MSHSLNSLKGGYIGDYIQGTTTGASKGDTRSLDYSSHVSCSRPSKTACPDPYPQSTSNSPIGLLRSGCTRVWRVGEALQLRIFGFSCFFADFLSPVRKGVSLDKPSTEALTYLECNPHRSPECIRVPPSFGNSQAKVQGGSSFHQHWSWLHRRGSGTPQTPGGCNSLATKAELHKGLD